MSNKITESIRNKLKKLWSTPPKMSSTDLLKLYHENPRLDGCRVIAQKCASTELFLYDRKDYRLNKDKAKKISDHELYDLLENPCPSFRDITGWTIRYFVFACYTLVGEAYLLKIRNPNGKVIALLPLSPSWVVKTPTVNAEYWEVYPYGTTAGNAIKVPVEDVIVFKDIDLLDPYGRGRGTSESIGDEIQSDEYAAKYAKNLFFNDATPSAIIYAPQGNKETADQIKQSWLSKMAGLNHAKEPMVLTGEGSKFEKIAQTPQELDFVNSRKYLRDSTNEHFHIPPEIMGILQNSNRSTIDSAFYLLNKNVLADYLRMYERVMNIQLLWEDFDKDRVFILHHENTIEEDIEQKLRIVNEGLSRGTLTVNDWRIAMGYEPDTKNGDVYLRNFSQIEVRFNSEEVELPEVEKPEEVVLPENENEENNSENDNEGKDNHSHIHKELSEEEFQKMRDSICKKYKVIKADEAEEKRRTAIWKTFDARARSIEEPFIKAMNKAFTKQNELAVKAITETLDNNKDVGTAIELLYNKEMDESLKHVLAGSFLNGLKVGAEHGQEVLNRKGVKEISDEVRRLFSLWVDNYGLTLCMTINDTTKKELRKVLSEALDAGDSIEVQKKKLIEAANDVFTEDKKWRAELIARTESCSTINAGSNILYQSEGVQNKMWISVRDDRTRDQHLAMDGVVIPMGEKFELPNGDVMEYPGDPSGSADNVCNCRCTESAFLD